MDSSRYAYSSHQPVGDGGHGADSDGPAPSMRSFRSLHTRRGSMEEDMFYRELMTSRPTQPPSYESALKAALSAQRRALAYDQGRMGDDATEMLPHYSCDVHVEGVFMRKMEIEDTIRRAEVRNWQTVYVVLHGTALHIYHAQKERWGFSQKEWPDIEPDNPPWVKKGSLAKSYSLLHADAGIAADYRKRRYVIRMRAETDQFLLSCVELETFIQWLDRIFAAIHIATPIDTRPFPRDFSIPRIQRIRYLRGQRSQADDDMAGFPRQGERRPSNASSNVTAGVLGGGGGSAGRTLWEEAAADDGEDNEDQTPPPPVRAAPAAAEHRVMGPATGQQTMAAHGRLSMTSYANESVDAATGKWLPKQTWTSTHDLLYAKLCFAVLLFKSPRKSNYIVSRGKMWYVDWATGRMVRMLPPGYGEMELYGPWPGLATENTRL